MVPQFHDIITLLESQVYMWFTIDFSVTVFASVYKDKYLR